MLRRSTDDLQMIASSALLDGAGEGNIRDVFSWPHSKHACVENRRRTYHERCRASITRTSRHARSKNAVTCMTNLSRYDNEITGTRICVDEQQRAGRGGPGLGGFVAVCCAPYGTVRRLKATYNGTRTGTGTTCQEVSGGGLGGEPPPTRSSATARLADSSPNQRGMSQSRVRAGEVR